MSATGAWQVAEWGDPGREPVLLLHGFLGRGDDWAGIAGRLADRWHLVAPDLPGHGRTPAAGPDACRMEAVAASVLERIDARDRRPWRLVGYSMGGRLALYLALRHPARFRSVALESSGPGLETEAERESRRRLDEDRARALLERPLREFVDRWYEQPLFATLGRDPARLARLKARRLESDPAGLAASLRGMGTGAQPSLWGELATARIPALLIAGEEDATFRSLAARMGARLPAARSVSVPGAGHNVHEEAPEAFAALLRDFFTSDSEVRP